MLTFSVQFHLNDTCNLDCIHCYQENFVSTNTKFSDIESFIQVTCQDFLPIYQKLEFNLTGGEPFLHPQLWEIIDCIGQQGAGVNLLTNGTLIDDSIIEKLAFRKIKGIQVSLEGLRSTNDRTRGQGVFDKVTATVRKLKQAKIPVSIALTIHQKNYTELQEYLEFFSDWDIPLGFHRYIPVEYRDQNHLNIQEPRIWKAIVKYLVQYKTVTKQKISMNDPLFGLELIHKHTAHRQKQQEFLHIPAGKNLGCSIGLTAVTVMPDGTIYPCRKLPIPIGNAFKEPLIKTWLHSQWLWDLRNRKNLKGKCGTCSESIWCGGCRASAYFSEENKRKKDLHHEDHLCFH